ncbi:MAG: type II toxin-antitoxin system VapC family toxin [Candidatus Diapherotrites archaeon]
MPKRVYLDSNVLISALRDEMDRQFRFLSAEAQLFFSRVRKNRDTVVLSSLFYFEVKKCIKISREEANEYFQSIGVTFEEAAFTEEHSLEEKRIALSGVHRPDSIHAAIAIKAGCDCIVSFNAKDFEKINRSINVIEPKDFI